MLGEYRIKFVFIFLIMQLSYSSFAVADSGTPIEGAFGFVLGDKIKYDSDEIFIDQGMYEVNNLQLIKMNIHSPIMRQGEINVKPIINIEPFKLYFLTIVPSTGELAGIYAYNDDVIDGKAEKCNNNDILNKLYTKYVLHNSNKETEYGRTETQFYYKAHGRELLFKCGSRSEITYNDKRLFTQAKKEIKNLFAVFRLKKIREEMEKNARSDYGGL